MPENESFPPIDENIVDQKVSNDIEVENNNAPIVDVIGNNKDSKIEIERVRQNIDQSNPIDSEKKPTEDHGTETFEVNGVNIQVDWHLYTPEIHGPMRETRSDTGLIFIPGWSSTSDSKSTIPLIQEFSKQVTRDSGSFVLSVSTRAEKIIKDSLFFEAEAIRRLIVARGLKEVVLTGHSQGGDTSINLASLLEENNPEISVDGLILLDAVGLYKQGKFELMQKFLRDEFKSLIGTKFSARIRQAEGDIIKGIGGEMSRSKLMYFKRLMNEIQDMAGKNPRSKEIKCPVILVQGEEDLISSPEKTKEVAERQELEDEWREDIVHDPRAGTLRGVFPNSSHLRWVKATNKGNHFVSLERAETVATASLYLLRRFHRKDNIS